MYATELTFAGASRAGEMNAPHAGAHLSAESELETDGLRRGISELGKVQDRVA